MGNTQALSSPPLQALSPFDLPKSGQAPSQHSPIPSMMGNTTGAPLPLPWALSPSHLPKSGQAPSQHSPTTSHDGEHHRRTPCPLPSTLSFPASLTRQALPSTLAQPLRLQAQPTQGALLTASPGGQESFRPVPQDLNSQGKTVLGTIPHPGRYIR